ncbi:MAG: hypothetical protein IPI19_15060 [Ignavibacteriales bacterium]|nr:hypothetical protein [Ignavibacteriales bacterium]
MRYTNTLEIKNNGSANIFFKKHSNKNKSSANAGIQICKMGRHIQFNISGNFPVVLTANSTFTAVFGPADLTVTCIVINEINYKSSTVFDQKTGGIL